MEASDGETSSDGGDDGIWAAERERDAAEVDAVYDDMLNDIDYVVPEQGVNKQVRTAHFALQMQQPGKPKSKLWATREEVAERRRLLETELRSLGRGAASAAVGGAAARDRAEWAPAASVGDASMPPPPGRRRRRTRRPQRRRKTRTGARLLKRKGSRFSQLARSAAPSKKDATRPAAPATAVALNVLSSTEAESRGTSKSTSPATAPERVFLIGFAPPASSMSPSEYFSFSAHASHGVVSGGHGSPAAAAAAAAAASCAPGSIPMDPRQSLGTISPRPTVRRNTSSISRGVTYPYHAPKHAVSRSSRVS